MRTEPVLIAILMIGMTRMLTTILNPIHYSKDNNYKSGDDEMS